MRLSDRLRRAPTIRQWLAMLLAAFVVPAAAAVALLFVYSYGRERAGIERANLDVARALMQTIDRELASAQGALQALGTSPNLDRGDLAAFYVQAADVLRYRPGNMLLLADRAGRQLINTGVPFGVPLPLHGNAAHLQRVIADARPAVSDLYVGPAVGRALTSVDVPVLRHGRVQYVLSMQYFGERLGAILERQKMPPQATATIYDSGGRIVWRSRGAHGDVGRRAGAALAAGLGLAPEGIVGDGADGDDGGDADDKRGGVRHVTAFSRSSVSAWTVAIALRRGDLNAALWRSLAWIALGTLGVLALGLVAVRAIGTRIEASVRGLVGPAIALGYGEPVLLPPLHLREAKDVGQALAQAAALLRERTRQRDHAERAENRLREANRAIERSEAFLRGIFEETPDGVLLVDRACRVTRANGQAEALFGYPQGALAGVDVDALLCETGPDARPVCARLRAAPPRPGAPLQARRRDATVFPVDAMARPLRERDLVIVTVRDMTDTWRTEEALRRALDDKNTLLKELYHRVKNNLQLIVSLFNLQVRSLADGGARQALLDAAGRVRAMALVHERLYQSGTLASIALDGYVGELCEQLAGAASAAQRGIALRIDAEPVEVGLETAVPLGLLLSELLTNSLKHGFPDGRGGCIDVRLVRRPDATLCLTVSDDGVGVPADVAGTSAQTLGLKLVTALSDQLHAHFTLERQGGPGRGGALATLVFSAAAPRAARAPAPQEQAARGARSAA